MSRCVIIGGAEIKDYDNIKKALRPDDFYIFCDSGLFHMKPLEVSPDLIIGDFDSHDKPEEICETIALPCEKDDTDTFFAAKEALRRGLSDFLLLGVCGGRLDHTLGNISILLHLHTNGAKAVLLDDFSEMEIADSTPTYVPDSFPYFSVINIDGTAHGITIENAKFPVENAEITPDYQYGISNEPLRGKTATVKVARGRALLIKVIITTSKLVVCTAPRRG